MFKQIRKRVHSFILKVKSRSKTIYKKTSVFIKRRPLGSFLIVLGLLLAVLLIGRIFNQTKSEEVKKPPVKTVTVYRIGASPKATFQAKVEKSGVVTLMAQAPGIVQHISVKEGQSIGKGGQVIALSSNYQGGNAASVQKQIAQAQYQSALDTFDPQREAIQKQREVATNSAESAQKIRDINKTSLNETGNLINDNQKQLDEMKRQLANLQMVEAAGITLETPQQEALQALPGAINQLQGGIYQLNAAQRTGEYQASNDNTPAKIANLQKDITLKQLDVQERGLSLSKDVAKLQADLAAVNEGTMYPASPFAGIVERVFVKIGQSVTPGTPLATVSSADTTTTVVVTLPSAIAKTISVSEPSTITIKNDIVPVKPYYVSSEATDGTLYSVFYEIPKQYQDVLSNGEFVQINIPLTTHKTSSVDPMIPIDAIYQTQENAFVLIDDHGKARTRTITLGSVYGNYVEVLSGLRSGDQIILDRNVVADDRVKIQ